MILCETSTQLGAYVLLTSLQENGHLQSTPKVLLVSDNSVSYEIHNSLLENIKNIPHIKENFSKIIHLNALIAPLHPREWTDIADGIKLLSLKSILTQAISPGGSIECLYLESIQVPPASTLARIFNSIPIHVYSDGLMSFSPTRSALPSSILAHIENLFYLDIYPGLKPPLLREANVKLRPLDLLKFKKIIVESTSSKLAETIPNLEGIPLFIGQYLSACGLMTPQEEVDLYATGLAQAATCNGANIVAFKPHPSFSKGMLNMLLTHNALKDFKLILVPGKEMLESILLYTKPQCIISVFSTGAALAKEIFGIEVYSYKSNLLFYSMHPWENSNRIPIMLFSLICQDLLVRKLYKMKVDQLQIKVDLVASSMQPTLLIPDKNTLLNLLSLPQNYDDQLFEHEARRRLQEFSPPQKNNEIFAILHDLPWDCTDLEYGVEKKIHDTFVIKKHTKHFKPIKVFFSFLANIFNKNTKDMRAS